MLVLAKAAEYVQWADNKTFCRGGPANKITYVVPPDSISPTITGAEYQHASPSGGGGGGRLSSSPDASVRIGRSYNPNQFSALASAAGIDATAGAGATDGQWQLTDFIKANIMD